MTDNARQRVSEIRHSDWGMIEDSAWCIGRREKAESWKAWNIEGWRRKRDFYVSQITESPNQPINQT
jgi:hypothetical protein